MALTPPSERIWWKEPIAKIELIWIFVAFTWGLIMFFMMIYWHGAGEQNLSNEAYKITPQRFAEKAQVMIDQYTVREENGFPVVHPPPGSDVYLIARLWQWWPVLELEKDESYRLHLSSMDWQQRSSSSFNSESLKSNMNLALPPAQKHSDSMTSAQDAALAVSAS